MAISFTLDCSYSLLLNSNEEYRPFMDVWLTRNVADSYVRLELKSAEGAFSHKVSLRRIGPVAMSALGESMFNVDVWAHIRNDHSEECLIPAGTAMIPLARCVASAVTAPLIFPMLEVHEGRIKGSLTVRVSDLRIDDQLVRDVPWRVRRIDPCPLRSYIERCERRYGPDAIRSTWKAMMLVNMFAYTCRVCTLPAAAYVHSMISTTGEEFFKNVAELSLKRMKLTRADVAAFDFTRPADAYTASCIFAHMISMYPQYCNYVGDEVWVKPPGVPSFRKMGIEWFQYVRHRCGCGDCEDVANEMTIIAREFGRLRTDDPLLRKLQEVLAAFFVVMLLDGVSAVEINIKKANAELDAHMNAALVSKAFMLKWLAGDSSRGPGPGLPPEGGFTIAPERMAGANPAFPPIIMLEGTGPLDPDGHARVDDVAEVLRDHLLRINAHVGECARQIFHYGFNSNEGNGFYKAVKLMSTSDIAHNRAIFNLFPQKKALTAGVTFQDMAAGNTNILVRAQEALTDEELALIDVAMLDMHPLPPLPPPSAIPTAQILLAREQMRQLVERVGRLPTLQGKGVEHKTVFMLKYEHFDQNGQLVRQLEEAIRKCQVDVPLIGFGVNEEPVTQNRGGFRVLLEWPDVRVERASRHTSAK